MGSADHWGVVLVNSKQGLAAMSSLLESLIPQDKVPQDVQRRLGVVLDELLINIISYAYPKGQPGVILVSLEMWDHKVITVLEDQGMPFDPFARMDPCVDQAAEDRPIGGLGLLLVKKLVSTYKYERFDDTNRVTLEQCFVSGGQGEYSKEA